jgi:hypothetical protein
VTSTVGVYDPTTATWYLRGEISDGEADVGQFAYGAPGWVAVVGDWNGDGVYTVGVVDPSTGTWYLRNENSPGPADAGIFQFGLPGWIPVVGDWNHTGHTGIGMFDPATGTWYLRNEDSAGPADAGIFVYGAPGWVPVAGDWDGNGTFTIGMFDPSTGIWYLRNENSAGAPDAGQFPYGLPGWKPVVGDWNGNGTTTVGVFDPAGYWHLRNSNNPGPADAAVPFPYGLGSWTPVAGVFRLPPQPLAAELETAALTNEQLEATVEAALQQLSAAGTPTDVLGRLSTARFYLATLGGNTLALADVPADQVAISSDGAGQGWVVESPASSSAESAVPSPGSTTGPTDLLSVIFEEMGQLVGQADLLAGQPGSARTEVLPAGVQGNASPAAVLDAQG